MSETLNTVAPDLTLIIPTRNEAVNIGPLLTRLDEALGAASAEILFVDDSEDDTVEQITCHGAGMRRAVRLLHRERGERAGGLGTAVVAGMRGARAPWVVVMDGDLQHPPEVVAALVDTGRRQDADLVVASRYAGHGSTAGLDGSARQGSSRLATRVAKLAFPRRTGLVSDPMSGFFAVRLGALDVAGLRPYGYKILLELIVRSPGLRTAEVTYRFQPRYGGESKTSFREALRFGRHLARLRLQIARERADAAQAEPLSVHSAKRLVDLAADGPSLDQPKDKRIRYLPYRYDVAGLVTIGSQVRLPELEYFRAQWLDADMDVAIRVGDVGRGTPIGRAVATEFVEPRALRYEEHLGRIGANFRIDLGSTIEVTVGPLLARSPHVVYTNIVEALLRFVVADRGRMLLHSACLDFDGHGIMLSARTDTGKTGTILRLLREQGGSFLSDDMTIVDAHAGALSFPKPLTISHHTLRAVQASDLKPGEWRRLRLQSRLHSKEGRSLALALSRYNLPIMAINAVTQIVVPPPKYNVDRLVPCRTVPSTTVRDLFLIERGTEAQSEVGLTQAVDELMVNTADAYGFPPFHYLAPAIVLGEVGYAELLRRERAVLTSAVARMNVRRLASDAFTWADTIPTLLAPKPAADDLALRVVPKPRSRPGATTGTRLPAPAYSGARASAAE